MAAIPPLRPLDAPCDAFDRAWRDGQRPRPEVYLSAVEPSLQASLLAE